MNYDMFWSYATNVQAARFRSWVKDWIVQQNNTEQNLDFEKCNEILTQT